MEESTFHKTPKIDQVEFVQNSQKTLTRSRLALMKGRIFWSRNNSESSIEKIKVRLRDPQPNKLQEQKERNRRVLVKGELEFLVKKLSLPKLGECTSASLHCQARVMGKMVGVVSPGRYTMGISKISHHRRSIQDEKVNQVLVRYNKRCENEIDLFNFNETTINKTSKPPPKQKKQKRVQI